MEMKNNNFFRHNVCHTCKSISQDTMKLCAHCKTVSYCSKKHQADDWRNHKTICKVMRQEKEDLVWNITNSKELCSYIQKRLIFWNLNLNRALSKSEFQMLIFPRYCVVCFSRDKLFACHRCLSTFYCSEKHQQQQLELHAKFCEEFRLSLEFDCRLYDRNECYFDMLSLKNNIDAKLLSIDDRWEFVRELVEPEVPLKRFQFLCNAERLFSGITILFALEKSRILINRIATKTDLTIHLVGSTELEVFLNWHLILEIWFVWIQNLKCLNVIFIGPELPANYRFNIDENFLINYEINMKHYKYLYHEIFDIIPKPDLVVAFNSGVHEHETTSNDLWEQSMNLLTQNNIPLMLTAYNLKEINNDLKRIQKLERIKTVYGPCRNPFRNFRPLINWEYSDSEPLYYTNNYLVIVVKEDP
ncbi:hypothetical protein ABEB36_013275 [Hypothenemus hampei]|uniref:MYND-type domain-containing protein n=1 Tax=Hypothenemus hampei TaxID=57062 RepID=A0ABD1E7F8_HYPHA